jgi:hypothetical protein
MLVGGLALLATGCDSVRTESFTGRLWTNWSVEHYQPAPRPEVKMFQRRDSQEILVEYIEQREKTGATHHRAYLLLANQGRVQDLKKPRFVSVKPGPDVTMIPVELSDHINLSAPIWAELTPDAEGFRFFRDGVPTDWYHLPVYLDKRDEAERILLTPVTVTADAAVVGAVIGVFAVYAYAGALCH